MSRMTNHEPDAPAEDEFEGPSKSELKRQSAELQRLGEALIELAPPELDALDLPEKLRDAVDLAKRITAHGGLYRQKQFIGKLMRKIDVEPIRSALEARRQQQRTELLRFRRVEQWRDRLLSEDTALAALLIEQPGADGKQLQRLVAQARHERERQQAPTAARELFRVLRELLDPLATHL
jgi:ribosome-associated protein